MNVPAAALAAIVLAAAGSALALPDPVNDAAVVQVEESDDNLYFVPAARDAQAENLREVWVFAAHKVPPTVNGDRIVGSWMQDRLDCAARTLQHLNGRALKADFTVAFTDEHGTDARPVTPGSVDESVLELVCGTDVMLGEPVAGVREAVRQAQATAR